MTILGTIELVEKNSLFIADDEQITGAFAQASENPIIAWLPTNGLLSPFLSRMYEIYRALGVQNLSKSVNFDVSHTISFRCMYENFHKIDLRECVIGKGLIKLVLGFLATTGVKNKHEVTKSLVELSLYGSDLDIPVKYSLELPLPSAKRLEAEVKRAVLWIKRSLTLYVQNSSLFPKQKNIESTSSFARAISEVVLTRDEHIDLLCRILQTGLLYNFDESVVEWILRVENLELSTYDKEFLENTFPKLATSRRMEYPAASLLHLTPAAAEKQSPSLASGKHGCPATPSTPSPAPKMKRAGS